MAPRVSGVAEGRWENTKVKPEWRGVTLRLLGGRGVLRDGGETRQRAAGGSKTTETGETI